MRSLLFAVFLSCVTFTAFSQDDNQPRNMSFKLYNLTTVERDYPPRFTDSIGNPNPDTYYNIQLLHPTFAFQWRNDKGNGHEIELTSIRMSTSETNQWYYHSRNTTMSAHAPYQHTSALISLRYEYILFVKGAADRKLVPSVGFGINPYYMADIYTSTVTTVFPDKFQSVGARFFAIPRLNYSISDRVYLDLNFPVSIYDYKFVFTETSNPKVPLEERKSNSIESESFAPVFSARFGVGIRL